MTKRDPIEARQPMTSKRGGRVRLAERLIDLAGEWARSRGGTTLVGGGPFVIQMPMDGPITYYVAVKMTGMPPPRDDKRATFHAGNGDVSLPTPRRAKRSKGGKVKGGGRSN